MVTTPLPLQSPTQPANGVAVGVGEAEGLAVLLGGGVKSPVSVAVGGWCGVLVTVAVGVAVGTQPKTSTSLMCRNSGRSSSISA